ncbi:zf-HC2 domain-containing protein [Pimelobacter simplex]|uniref:Zf-HC2 domain-containing protein n=1 Tax=Nocardioides simplex TaxID=2045 RepID=A0A7J5E1P2_NOCSI|nr:zf-HC2 domain-containing protein [Pimelobacter simplex]KAB2812181.1 zf-HC2 domain-containing protein [Pimelobacter simplex]
MTTHPYADWDAAYVLGALSSSERREYEAHVDDCARCAAAVAEVGMLPGLLRLVPDDDAAALLAEAPADVVRTPGRVPARRPVRRRALAGMAAAVLLVGGAVTGVVVGSREDAPPAGRTVALAGVAERPVPLRASVRLTPTAWGTAIAMTCTYTGSYGDRYRYALYVVDDAGQRQLVSRWQAGPGETARTTGSTDLAPSAIERVELRAEDGTVLLAGTP